MGNRRKKKLISGLVLITVIALVIIFDVAMFTNVLTSFKSDADISSSPPKWIFKPTLEHYKNVLGGDSNFPAYLENSIIIALASSALAILITFPAAYSIIRFGGFGNTVLATTLVLRLMPAMGMAIPIFAIFNTVHLVDTRLSIILMHTLFIAPTSLLLLMGYVSELPIAIEEAARIDGANIVQILVHILFPIVRPGLTAVAILGFITSWNEFLFSVILSFKNAVTATVGTSFFVTAYAVEWGDMAAAITVSTIPTLLFIFIAQRQLIKGMTAGAVK